MKGKIKSFKPIQVLKSATISAVAVLTLIAALNGCKANLNQNADNDISSISQTQMEETENTKATIQPTIPADKPSSTQAQIERIRSMKLKPYEALQHVRNIKMPTYVATFPNEYGVRQEYNFAQEEDVLNVSRELSYVIEDYFKSCGASNWANEDKDQFWPEDIEYVVTAIAFRESTYRTNVINNIGCAGLTCIKEDELLKTLGNEWLVSRIWGKNVPQVNCNSETVDMFNGTTGLEYTYYNIGYNLANRFKKDKYFTDVDGVRKSVWQVLDYSDEMQKRLIIASHLFGVNNVVDAVFGRAYDNNGNKVSLEDYINCGYVEDVMDKTYELINTYEQGLEY